MTAKETHAAELKVQDLSKTFRNGKRTTKVLKNVSLTVKAGSITCIVGRSGCGKSTLLRIIAGLETQYEGTVTLGQKQLKAPGLNRGMIFQDHRLLPWLTVEQNIAFALKGLTPKEARRRILTYLRRVGLKKCARHYPHQLSGGMAQRVAIARALINQPEILLLDEPFGALDALTKIQMQQEVLDIWKEEKTTMILVTHDIDEAIFLGDDVIVMTDGKESIQKRIAIELKRPRDRSSPNFMAIRKEILGEFFGKR